MKKHRTSQAFLARKREKARLKKLRRLEQQRQYKAKQQKKRDEYYGDI